MLKKVILFQMAMVAMAENGCPARGMLYTKVLKKCETCENIDLDEIIMVSVRYIKAYLCL